LTAPGPPTDLARRAPLTITLPAGTLLHRFHTAAFEPVFFDRSCRGRFNAPDGSYGVLYVAATVEGAFAETFLREPGRTLLPTDLLASRAYVVLWTTRALVLVRLGGAGLARHGATAEIVHGGPPHAVPQAWSSALRAHPFGLAGIAYSARHDDDALCYALFEATAGTIEEVRRERDLDQGWFWRIAERYHVGLAPH